MEHMECITQLVQLNPKTTMLKPSLCDNGDAYILAKGTMTVYLVKENTQPQEKQIEKIAKQCLKAVLHLMIA